MAFSRKLPEFRRQKGYRIRINWSENCKMSANITDRHITNIINKFSDQYLKKSRNRNRILHTS